MPNVSATALLSREFVYIDVILVVFVFFLFSFCLVITYKESLPPIFLQLALFLCFKLSDSICLMLTSFLFLPVIIYAFYHHHRYLLLMIANVIFGGLHVEINVFLQLCSNIISVLQNTRLLYCATTTTPRFSFSIRHSIVR